MSDAYKILDAKVPETEYASCRYTDLKPEQECEEQEERTRSHWRDELDQASAELSDVEKEIRQIREQEYANKKTAENSVK